MKRILCTFLGAFFIFDMAHGAVPCDNAKIFEYIQSVNRRCVNEYINSGADVNIANKRGDTPLHYLARHGDLDAVRALVERGADVNAKNNIDETPLHYAAESGDTGVVEYLIDHGATVNSVNDADDTPLHYAAWYGRLANVKYLVQHGANTTAKNSDGKTPHDWTSDSAVRQYLSTQPKR